MVFDERGTEGEQRQQERRTVAPLSERHKCLACQDIIALGEQVIPIERQVERPLPPATQKSYYTWERTGFVHLKCVARHDTTGNHAPLVGG